MATKKSIRESLLRQLKASGADLEHFLSLVDDYCWYWEQQRAMQKDIKQRGRTYVAISSQGKEYEKDNPSVKNAQLYSRQMLAILKELGLTTDNVTKDDDDTL